MTTPTSTDAPVTVTTCGGSGIGAAIARRLLDAGHRVAVTGRDLDRLHEFAAGTDRPDRPGSTSTPSWCGPSVRRGDG